MQGISNRANVSKTQRSYLLLADKLRDELRDYISESVESLDYGLSVLSFADLTSIEPASPDLYDRYVCSATGTGNVTEFSFTENYIYSYGPEGWEELVPFSNMVIIDLQENKQKIYNSGWEEFFPTLNHDDLSGLNTSDDTMHLTATEKTSFDNVSVVTLFDRYVGSSAQVTSGEATDTMDTIAANIAAGDSVFLYEGDLEATADTTISADNVYVESESKDAKLITDTYSITFTGDNTRLNVWVSDEDKLVISSLDLASNINGVEQFGDVPNSSVFMPANADKALGCIKKITDEGADLGAVCSHIDVTPTLTEGRSEGGVYDPIKNRVYFVPYTTSGITYWLYLDCDTLEVVEYAPGVAITKSYWGGAFVPTLNRIYFAPYFMYGESSWHYVDCETGNIVEYAHGLSNGVSGQYKDAIYCPRNNKLYFVPYNSQTEWIYLDCETETMGYYAHGQTFGSTTPFLGGAYTPVQNRIYLVPSVGDSNCYYIDCETDTVGSITTPSNVLTSSNDGAVYCPYNNRIYLTPYFIADEATWHYIDCDAEEYVEYTHTATAVNQAYRGNGAYCPLSNRVYLPPYSQKDQTYFHYIDCFTGDVVEYASDQSNTSTFSTGGVFVPSINKIVFIPYPAYSDTAWYCVDILSNRKVPRAVQTLFR